MFKGAGTPSSTRNWASPSSASRWSAVPTFCSRRDLVATSNSRARKPSCKAPAIATFGIGERLRIEIQAKVGSHEFGSRLYLFPRGELEPRQHQFTMLGIAEHLTNGEPGPAGADAIVACEFARLAQAPHLRMARSQKPLRERIGRKLAERRSQSGRRLVETPPEEMTDADAGQMKRPPRGAGIKPQRHLE